VNVGLGVGVGTTSRGAGAGGFAGAGVGAFGCAEGATGVAAAGLVSTGAGGTGGRTGVGGGVGVCCLARIALRTSPGLEICERSIFVLISSESLRGLRAVLPDAEDSACARKCRRTLSASSSSMEEEWVFFSVTPTCGSTSRIALLLTSSSLARSLIRILLIRRFYPSELSR
jgi:hypothetical protein